MNDIKHITFTGVDSRTDLNALEEIQKEFPIAEFGVLTSYNWAENGNRYLDPAEISKLMGRNLNLSLHICGSATRDAMTGNWEKIDEFIGDHLNIFKRCQLNVSGRKNNPEFAWMPLIIGQEVIIQQHDKEHIDLFLNSLKQYPHDKFFSVLLDASGGTGLDTSIDVLSGNYKVGYAGGIGPDNVADKLSELLKQEGVGDFWIDMESKVRTDDWFDLDKVHRVLKICKEVYRDFAKEMISR